MCKFSRSPLSLYALRALYIYYVNSENKETEYPRETKPRSFSSSASKCWRAARRTTEFHLVLFPRLPLTTHKSCSRSFSRGEREKSIRRKMSQCLRTISADDTSPAVGWWMMMFTNKSQGERQRGFIQCKVKGKFHSVRWNEQRKGQMNEEILTSGCLMIITEWKKKDNDDYIRDMEDELCVYGHFLIKKRHLHLFFLRLCSIDYDRCSTQGGNGADHHDDDYYSSFFRSFSLSRRRCARLWRVTGLLLCWTSFMTCHRSFPPSFSTGVVHGCLCAHAPEPGKSRENVTCVTNELCTSSIVRKPEQHGSRVWCLLLREKSNQQCPSQVYISAKWWHALSSTRRNIARQRRGSIYRISVLLCELDLCWKPSRGWGAVD